ncbi:hypothetical protein [Diaphorobacter caeni]|uniref:hypothetical protein n=1 Tax=Diaphorobacter caeni TaxID=2784387 RepID=UPI00188E0032|nr:hypothetical protein [Diaphorobacter caeni]
MNTTTQTTSATSQIIWDAILGMRANSQAISRQRLMELTGLTYTKIDDHVSRWIEDGRLRRVVDGVYELVDPMPEPRTVMFSDTPDGMTVIEVGDQVLKVWPREAQIIAMRLRGNLVQYAQLQTQHDMGALLAEVMTQKRAMTDRVSDLERVAQQQAQEIRELRKSAQMSLIV